MLTKCSPHSVVRLFVSTPRFEVKKVRKKLIALSNVAKVLTMRAKIFLPLGGVLVVVVVMVMVAPPGGRTLQVLAVLGYFVQLPTLGAAFVSALLRILHRVREDELNFFVEILIRKSLI